jgi:hypothetical protein
MPCILLINKKKLDERKFGFSKYPIMKSGHRRIRIQNLSINIQSPKNILVLKSRILVKLKVQISKSNLKPGANTEINSQIPQPIQTANQINSRIPQSMYEVHNLGADTKPKLNCKPDSRLNPRPKFHCC